MMTGDREMRATRGLNDTQLMLARDAGDERGGSAITPPGPDGAGRVAGPIIRSTDIKGEWVRRSFGEDGDFRQWNGLAVLLPHQR
jgi:hypothetical protein